jgi:nucleoside-diphosphate-sugar epimerase/GT2 family glycosyltransferase
MVVISASMVLYRPDLTVVEQALRALLAAARFAQAHESLRFDLTLVDNSNDAKIFEDIVRWHERMGLDLPNCTISLRRAPRNLGYGCSNNLVIDHVVSDYHLVVNPDLFVQEDALLEAVRYMDARRDVGMLTPAVFSIDGTRQYLCKHNPTLLIMFLRGFAPSPIRSAFKSMLDQFEMRDCNYDEEIHSVSYPTGCFMFFRTSSLKNIGGFDPKIFLHFEDADIGRRLLSTAGVNYVPTVVVTHLWMRDTHKSWRGKLNTVKSGWYYFQKWGWDFLDRTLKVSHPPMRRIETVCTPVSNVGQCGHVLVTGANGFIGRAVCMEFPRHGLHVKGAVRHMESSQQITSVRYVAMGNFDAQTNWTATLGGVDCILHLAARVHVMSVENLGSTEEFNLVNVESTINLARQAANAGVRRFVFLSSIKVNGEFTELGQPFTADDVPAPKDAYGVSKYEAEQLLRQISEETGMEVVIIRPPLVYGPGVRANFESMTHQISHGVLLPLAAITNNRRSLVALDNLIDLILTCLYHPAAANQIFLVSDGEDISTVDLLNRIGKALGHPARLFYVSPSLLKLGAVMINKLGIYQRLCSSLQLDITKTRQLLGWTPPISVDEGLRRVVKGIRA